MECVETLMKSEHQMRDWVHQGFITMEAHQNLSRLPIWHNSWNLKQFRFSSLVPIQQATQEKRRNLKDLIKKEEADLKQRSKVSWLRLGNTKSRFFSRVTKKIRRAKNNLELGVRNISKSCFLNLPPYNQLSQLPSIELYLL